MKQLELKGPAGTIAVHVSGSERGIPVLLSHSILSSSMMWERQAGLLAGRGMRVVCMDTRGHGGSSAPAHNSAASVSHSALPMKPCVAACTHTR